MGKRPKGKRRKQRERRRAEERRRRQIQLVTWTLIVVHDVFRLVADWLNR